MILNQYILIYFNIIIICLFLALSHSARQRQNLYETRERIIAIGADPTDTPEIHLESDAYSVYSDLNSVTPSSHCHTLVSYTRSGKVFYEGASTIYPDEQELTEEDFKDLTTQDFDSIDFAEPSAVDENDEKLKAHDGSDCPPKCKINNYFSNKSEYLLRLNHNSFF